MSTPPGWLKDSDKALEMVYMSKYMQKHLVEKHNGKWLEEMGDGAMARFNTALDAVNCSIVTQEFARAKLDGKLRIGIHLGTSRLNMRMCLTMGSMFPKDVYRISGLRKNNVFHF